MSKDNDKRNNNDGGFGAVFLVIVVLAAMAFVGGGDQPLDRIADLVIICTWILSIGFLILVIFFVMALCLQTAMADLYESLLEDFEHSPLRAKIERYKAFFDKKILGRTYKPTFKSKEKSEKTVKKPKPKAKKPLTKEERELKQQQELEEEVFAMMAEEHEKNKK